MANVLMPEYMKDFHCIGPECEYTCCQRWYIGFTKDDYRKIMAMEDELLKAKMLKHMKRSDTAISYAKMQLDKETGRCPLLTEDGLCPIQRDLGEDALPKVCQTYPRYAFEFGTHTELSATLSCPPAARKALLNEQPMEFVRASVELNPGIINRISWPDSALATRMSVRAFVIAVLQDRRYSFEDRLVLLGIFLKKIDGTKEGELAATVELYQDLFDDPSIMDGFKQAPAVYPFQLYLINDINEAASTKQLDNDPAYLKLLYEVLSGIGSLEGLSSEERLGNYLAALKTTYEPVREKLEHVYENFFVNEAFVKFLPYSDRIGSIWGNYIYICALYAMLKFYLVGISAHDRSLSDERLISTISVFARNIFVHDAALMKNLIKYLEKEKLDTLANMAMLVRG